METTGVLPKGPLHDFRQGLIELAYRGVYTVLGSYIAASLAPNRPMNHALALGVVGFVVNILGAVATWMQVGRDKSGPYAPGSVRNYVVPGRYR